MCGIVGLLLKRPELQPQLGELMLPMLGAMTERGPDSAGLAVFSGARDDGRIKLSLYFETTGYDWDALHAAFAAANDRDSRLTVHGIDASNHATLETASDPAQARRWLERHDPQLHVLAAGASIELYKDTGLPLAIAKNYDFAALQGSHVVGHTRMATESAVTPAHAHPFTAGQDFCLVHNGSLSNPYSVRRRLEPLGMSFVTDNDTEAACRFLEWRMREGDSLEAALERGLAELDGFFTFLIGTRDQLALVRDPFACKPAVVAQTDDWVAISSEFRGLARLPGIEHAEIFEPAPERIYVWRTGGNA
ncbi:MAG: class II glutamine amidotransferase [Lautropia sp.]